MWKKKTRALCAHKNNLCNIRSGSTLARPKTYLRWKLFLFVGQGEFTKTFITKFSINSAATGGHRGRCRRRRRRWRLRISASWPGDGMEVCGTWVERRP